MNETIILTVRLSGANPIYLQGS